MYTWTKSFFVCAILSGLLQIHVSVLIKTNQARNGRRECKPVNECDFYLQFLDNDVPWISKEVLDKEFKRQACGLNIYGEVEKGRLEVIILVLMIN